MIFVIVFYPFLLSPEFRIFSIFRRKSEISDIRHKPIFYGILEIELEKDTEIEKEIPPSAFAFYGRYKNVCLTPTDLDELKTEMPDTWEHYINRLSEYMASTGKNYDNHAATIRRWAANDTEKNTTVQGVTALSCKEGTSL
jgi:hypothetical protein